MLYLASGQPFVSAALFSSFFVASLASERAERGFSVRGHQHPPSPRHPLYGFLRMHARFLLLRLKISTMQVMCA